MAMENRLCKGFMAAGVHSGLKEDEKLDLGLIYSEVPAQAAAVFTSNRVKAAPLIVSMEKIKSGKCQAVIVNSGNANCCVGLSGMGHARDMAIFAARELGINASLVIPSSTGVIGKRLPIEKIEAAAPALVRSLRPEGMDEFARAIMTTDTFPKIASESGEIDGKTFTVTGVAKGSGMIHPDMATMLCFICSDIQISQESLNKTLGHGVAKSFNRITVDGDTSTNDMAMVMANGMSGATAAQSSDLRQFRDMFDSILLTLSKKIVKDGEGATKLVEIIVKGAFSQGDAQAAADAVAGSNLVKTAFYGEDPNWGRIMGAVGRSGASVDQDAVDIYFGDVLMVKNGIGRGDEAEKQAGNVLKKKEFSILIDLNMGDERASMFTCDFSEGYVEINADYRHRT